MRGVADESITEYVAQFACATRFEDIPADVLGLAKRMLLDCIGLALAGAQSAHDGYALAVAGADPNQALLEVLPVDLHVDDGPTFLVEQRAAGNHHAGEVVSRW